MSSMPEVSSFNHFEFGYNDNPFTYRKNVNDRWFARYGRAAQKPLHFGRECLRTAALIGKKKTNLPIHVMFSGGIDSEVVLRSFVGAGIPVEAAILKFKNDLNIHDIAWAIVACEEFGVPYRLYELDILKFWDGPAIDFADATYCVSPQLLSTMWLAEQVQGYPILGSGECLLVRRDAPLEGEPTPENYGEEAWELFEKEKIASWYRYFMVRGRDACPGFFQYTPEIMLSYLCEPMVWDLCRNNLYGKYTTYFLKYPIYQKHFKTLRKRPKFTGFEKIMHQDAQLREFLVNRYPNCNQIQKTTFDNLLKQLSPEDFLPSDIESSIR